MRIPSSSRSGLTLVELSVTVGLVGVVGLIIYSLLNIGTILGAKNTATNTAHQQARVAMLKVIQDVHEAISLPQLVDVNGSPVPTASPGATVSAAGVSFQKWSMGPLKIIADTAAMPGSQNFVKVRLSSNAAPAPKVGQRLIIQTHQIEGDITAVSGTFDNMTVTLANLTAPSPPPSPAPSPANGTLLSVQIQGTTSGPTPAPNGDVTCFIADRCSYRVVVDTAGPPVVYKLQYIEPAGIRDIVTDITNPTPFSIPLTPAGAQYSRFVAAIDLSTSDPKYTNRGYKAANILLNGQIPYKARLTTYQ